MTDDPNIDTTQPTSEATAESTPEPAQYHRPKPYQTFAKPDEIKRESENRTALALPNASVAEICAEWVVAVPVEFESPAQGTLS